MQTSFTSFEPPEVFISYATKDHDLLEEFKPHLEGLERRGIIRSWWGRDIVAGTDWEKEICEHIKSAQLILLLVSKHFLASESCYVFELQLALGRYEIGAARLISIILSESNWKSTPLSKIQVLPKGGTPVDRWDDVNEAFVNVAEGITEAVRQLEPCLIPKPVARDPYIEVRRPVPAVKYALGVVAVVIVAVALFIFTARLPWYKSPEVSVQSAQPNSSSSPSEVKIQVIEIPQYNPIGGPNSIGHIGGTVAGATSPQFHLVIYSFTTAWYVQPWKDDTETRINPDGSWSADIKTGARYAVLLVQANFQGPSPISENPTRLHGVITSIEFEGKR